jgi:hypothetical protein
VNDKPKAKEEKPVVAYFQSIIPQIFFKTTKSSW